MPNQPAAPPLFKSAHITQNIDAVSLIRALKLDYVVSTDGMLIDVWNGDYTRVVAIGLPYQMRVPTYLGLNGARNVCDCPVFNGVVEILNEPDLWNQPPALCATWVTQTINNFHTADPNRQFKFILGAGSQVGFDASWYVPKFGLDKPFVAETWRLLPQEIKAQIDCIGVHFYPGQAALNSLGMDMDMLYDPNLLRRWLRQVVRSTENTYGIVDANGVPLDVLVTESGYETMTPKGSPNSVYVAENQKIAALIPQVMASVATLTWARGVHWYLANYWQDDKSPWNTLINQSGARLTAAGQAWAAI